VCGVLLTAAALYNNAIWPDISVHEDGLIF